ncbi:hypothetical protein ACH5RR_003010 [Cinchona calisaya]|uniref:Uncharacterized protein n=1 Tax=Cinchona calisaya TaxID=153742 RepID=A0ABD3ATQ8_9GENT
MYKCNKTRNDISRVPGLSLQSKTQGLMLILLFAIKIFTLLLFISANVFQNLYFSSDAKHERGNVTGKTTHNILCVEENRIKERNELLEILPFTHKFTRIFRVLLT